jgi:hypothetical protein
MHYRKLVSLVLCLGAPLLCLTGLALLFRPAFMEWRPYIEPLHEYAGIALLVCLPLHIFFNARVIAGYFSRAASRARRIFSTEFALALACLAMIIIPAIREGYGRPRSAVKIPAITEVNVENLLEGIGLNYAEAKATMAAEGWVVPEGRYTLMELARLNKINPRLAYVKIASGQSGAGE